MTLAEELVVELGHLLRVPRAVGELTVVAVRVATAHVGALIVDAAVAVEQDVLACVEVLRLLPVRVRVSRLHLHLQLRVVLAVLACDAQPLGRPALPFEAHERVRGEVAEVDEHRVELVDFRPALRVVLRKRDVVQHLGGRQRDRERPAAVARTCTLGHQSSPSSPGSPSPAALMSAFFSAVSSPPNV